MHVPRPWLFALFLLAGCSSSPVRDLEKIHSGMDKDEVLQQAGNPKRTFRSNGQDHWIYVYFLEDREYLRDVIFLDGKVHRLGKPVPKQSLEKSLENAQSLEEFEAKAREHQQRNSSFKDIDGGEARANGK